MLKFTVKDNSHFEYLQTSPQCINGKHKPWYVLIVNTCLNPNNLWTGANWKYILRHVIHVACLVYTGNTMYQYVILNLYFRLCLKFYVPWVTWINSPFVCFPQSMAHKWNKYTLECLKIAFFEYTALCKFEKRLWRTFAFCLCEPRLSRKFFFFHHIIAQTTKFCTVLVLVLYRAYQDAF